MFTEINGEIYLDSPTLTWILADGLRDLAQGLNDELLETLLSPIHAQIQAEAITEGFQEHYGRPGDIDNEMNEVFDNLADCITWAAQRETDERAHDQLMDRVDYMIETIMNHDNEEDF